MPRFHFVHTAGLRLNSPFAAVGRVPDRVRDQLADAPSRAWDDLVGLCIDRNVAFVVIAGGALDASEVATTAPLRLRNGLKRLAEHGVKSFVALGADDDAVGAVLADARIGGVTVFPADRPLTVKVERNGAPIAAVCGQSGGGGDVESFFAGAPEGLPLIGVLAGPTEDLDRRIAARGKMKGSYWALGNATEPSRRGFAPWIVECGTLQGRGNDPRQRGARGAMLVEVDGERVLAVDQVAADRVRYAELTLVPRFPLDDALLCHQLMDELNRLRAAHAGRALLVDVVIEAPNRATAEPLVTPERGRALLQRLRDETAAWDPFVWCASLRPAATALDGGADPLAQAIVQESRTLLANPMQRSYAFARRFDPLMRRWTSELETGDAERLIDEASALALAAARRADRESAV